MGNTIVSNLATPKAFEKPLDESSFGNKLHKFLVIASIGIFAAGLISVLSLSHPAGLLSFAHHFTLIDGATILLTTAAGVGLYVTTRSLFKKKPKETPKDHELELQEMQKKKQD